jgi:adenylate cyclase
MGIEIERKYLVRHQGWREHVRHSEQYLQGYLLLDGRASVRVRVSGDRARLNIKSGELSIFRREYEYEIPRSDALEMLDSLCTGSIIDKRRHFVDFKGHTWEIDVFGGENAGLVVAEIELNDADEPFAKPDWLGEEVSEDPRYFNVSLVTHPFREWSGPAPRIR